MINQWKTKRKSHLAQETRTYPEGICSLTEVILLNTQKMSK